VDGQVVREVLAERFPEVPAEVHDELCDLLQPLLAAQVAEAESALRSSLQSKHKVVFEQTEKFVQERYEQLALGLRALEGTKLADSPLYPYLMREVVTEPLHRLIALRWQEVNGASTEVTAATRRQCLDKLAAKQGAAQVEALAKLAAALAKGKDDKESGKEAAKETKDEKGKKGKKAKGKRGDDSDDEEAKETTTTTDVVDLYHAAASDCHIFCRKVDKKREKAAIQEQRVVAREKLKDEALSDDLQICQLGLRIALLGDAVPGLAFPMEMWALKLVAQSLGSEALRDEAVALCNSIEKGADAVALEAAVAAWRSRGLGGGEKPAD